ncbi:MAG: methyltransferase domain-containing protein [Deltaproteobacteria bacterium]|nr:methyltransferase domain-containing protein [Deltaproteobacteria bacterium]
MPLPTQPTLSPQEAKRLFSRGVELVARHGRNGPLITAVGDAALLAGDHENALACYIAAMHYDPAFQPAQEKCNALVKDLQARKLLVGDIPLFHFQQYCEDTAAQYDALVQDRLQHTTADNPIIQCVLDFLQRRPARHVLMPCCGVGVELAWIHTALPATQFTGLDWSQNVITCAQRRCGDGVELVQGDVCRLPFADQTFDCAFTIGGLMAVANGRQAIDEIRRVSRTGILLIESSLEHIPLHDLMRGIRLITPGIWMHRYEALFQECHLHTENIATFPAAYLTGFSLTPLP